VEVKVALRGVTALLHPRGGIAHDGDWRRGYANLASSSPRAVTPTAIVQPLPVRKTSMGRMQG
jgi:hypothetical protein